MLEQPSASPAAPMVQVRDLKMHFPIYAGLLRRRGLSLEAPAGHPGSFFPAYRRP